MTYQYILFFIHKCLTLYNKLCLMLFKLYFYPYYYRTNQGDIIKCEYLIKKSDWVCINNENNENLIVTYECDKLYNCYNRLIYYPKQYLLSPDPIYTNYVFINITLLVEDCQITMYLRTNKYNFYICENVINSEFILYYLQNMHHMFLQKQYLYNPFNKDNLSYKLIILDHCFKEHNLTQLDTIILHKNTFEVIKNNKKE